MKLHLGCGRDYRKGYVNIDLYKPPADLIDDIVRLKEFKPNSIDEIICNHALEHLDLNESFQALERWYELLKSGGSLSMEVPDFYQSCKEFVVSLDDISKVPDIAQYPTLVKLTSSGDLGIYSNWGRVRNIFGAQDAFGQYHKSGWWKTKLEQVLTDTGFSKITITRSVEGPKHLFSYHVKEEPVILAEAVK